MTQFQTALAIIAGLLGYSASLIAALLWLNKQFSDTRKLIYNVSENTRKDLKVRDRAIKRLEFWAVLQRTDPPFQPGADPVEFNGGG